MSASKSTARPRLAVLAAIVTLGLFAAALPATANATVLQIKNVGTGWCLDSNHQGQVYMNPCSTSNNYQKWDRWEFGWAKNVATGYCLTTEGSGYVATRVCNQNAPYQWWVHWQGGWFQSPQYTTPGGQVVSAACLHAVSFGSASVKWGTCSAAGPLQIWNAITV